MPGPAKTWMIILCACAVMTLAPTQAKADDEFDNAKWKLQLNGWISAPSGYFNGADHNGYFDLERDFGFGNYATFNGKLDWRFKRKHHLLFGATPALSSRTTTLTRTIVWQGQTYDVGARVEANIESLILTPGYQWDFLRRRSGWLGLLVNCNLAYTQAKLKLAASVSGGGTGGSATTQSSGCCLRHYPRWDRTSSGTRSRITAVFTLREHSRGCRSSVTATSCRAMP
jgi:hypothetical protein